MSSWRPTDFRGDQKLGAGKPRTEKPVAVERNERPVEGNETEGLLRQLISERLQEGLQNIYGNPKEPFDKSLEGSINKGEEMIRKLAEMEVGMGCGLETAMELILLTLYNVAILVDDSTTMLIEDDGWKRDILITLFGKISEICWMANDHTVHFLNREPRREKGDLWKDYLGQHKFSGMTKIGTELRRQILDELVTNNLDQDKPLRVLIFTDGAIEGEKKGLLQEVIQNCVEKCEADGKGKNAVSFQFLSIRKDPGVNPLLEDLKNDPYIGENINFFEVRLDDKGGLDDEWFTVPKILLNGISPVWNDIKEEDHKGGDSKSELQNNK